MMESSKAKILDAFERLDLTYSRTGSNPILEKAYDDAIRTIEDVAKKRNKLLKSIPEEEAYSAVLAALGKSVQAAQQVYEASPRGFIEKLERLRKKLEGTVELLEKKLADVRAKKENYRMQAKRLILGGRIDDAKSKVPIIAQLEKAEEMITGYIAALRRLIGRLEALAIGYDTIVVLANELNLQSLTADKREIEKARNKIVDAKKKLESLETDITELQNMVSLVKALPEGLLTEEEERIFMQLLDEVQAEAGPSGNLKDMIEQLKSKLEKAEKELASLQEGNI